MKGLKKRPFVVTKLGNKMLTIVLLGGSKQPFVNITYKRRQPSQKVNYDHMTFFDGIQITVTCVTCHVQPQLQKS